MRAALGGVTADELYARDVFDPESEAEAESEDEAVLSDDGSSVVSAAETLATSVDGSSAGPGEGSPAAGRRRGDHGREEALGRRRARELTRSSQGQPMPGLAAAAPSSSAPVSPVPAPTAPPVASMSAPASPVLAPTVAPPAPGVSILPPPRPVPAAMMAPFAPVGEQFADGGAGIGRFAQHMARVGLRNHQLGVALPGIDVTAYGADAVRSGSDRRWRAAAQRSGERRADRAVEEFRRRLQTELWDLQRGLPAGVRPLRADDFIITSRGGISVPDDVWDRTLPSRVDLHAARDRQATFEVLLPPEAEAVELLNGM
ncbi:hypothetical protein AN220_13030, partial [Streptomyces nanshensis]